MSDEAALNLAGPIRMALIGNAAIAALLSTWEGEPAVFTRRPVPGDSDLPVGIVNPDMPITDEDMLNTEIAVIARDVAFYGQQADPGSSADMLRKVESLAYLTRRLFHRQKNAITPPASPPTFHVLDCVARGPFVAPVDDDQHVGRVVRLTFRVQLLFGP